MEKIDEIPEPSPSASPIAPARPIARNRLRETAVSIAIFLAFWGIYLATGNYQPSPFNAHVYLAYSLLHRRFDLIDPPGFFETARFAGHTYIAYGIGPSLLMLPFVAIWGLDFRQPVFAAALAAAAVTLWSATLTHLRFRGRSRILLTLLFGLGSLVWFYGGAKGNSWSLMHVTTLFGLTLAIYETLARGRGWLTGLAFGIAVLSRQTVLLALPFFVWSLWRDGESPRRNFNRELGFALCLCAPILFDAYYNAARFGSPWDSGYPRVIVAITALRFRPWGLFSLNYVAANARTYFLKLPENLPSFPWYDPTMA
ncbi:MAG TPA: hypothetical protein VHS07_04470, partial [Candidatus Binataceae bacterium]|nr:hypothetical protein [Candidatus Binataceae bacterium]